MFERQELISKTRLTSFAHTVSIIPATSTSLWNHMKLVHVGWFVGEESDSLSVGGTVVQTLYSIVCILNRLVIFIYI